MIILVCLIFNNKKYRQGMQNVAFSEFARLLFFSQYAVTLTIFLGNITLIFGSAEYMCVAAYIDMFCIEISFYYEIDQNNAISARKVYIKLLCIPKQ